MTEKFELSEDVVRALIKSQFPQWYDMSLTPVPHRGWDNYTFRLGSKLLLRFPSADPYKDQVDKEQHWLPILASKLPLAVPEPVALGMPGEGYPWKWSVYRWLEGETVASQKGVNKLVLAAHLGRFLRALQGLDVTGGPVAGRHSFHRGEHIKAYHDEFKWALEELTGRVNVEEIEAIWRRGMATEWQGGPVWVHGDISPGNLLIYDGKLTAVIDFGQLNIGDPACDLGIAWTYFDDDSRYEFQQTLDLDADTWLRARCWVLWKAVITASQQDVPDNYEAKRCWQTIENVLVDTRS